MDELDGVTSPGHRYSHLYGLFCSIKKKCEDFRAINYDRYGGRGISIWSEWRHDHRAFIRYLLTTLGDRPKGMQLERIDNSKGYDPGNLRWATFSEQQINKRPHSNTGYKYIAKLAKIGKFRVVFNRRHIGTFQKLANAIVARNKYLSSINFDFSTLQDYARSGPRDLID